MTERAQALEAALIGAGVLAQEVLASRQNVGNYLRQLAQSVLNDLSTTENIPQPIQRFDLVSVSFAYTSDHEMQRSDDGEWVRFDDVFPPAALSPVEPTVHNDLCSWCLTQADHVAASEECYERNSERGRITTRPPVEPTPPTEQFMIDALAAAVADRDHSDAQLAAIEAVVRQELCPIENSESQGDDEPEPRYICMNEDGDRIIEADDIAGVIRQVVARWDAAGKRCEAAEASLEALKSPVEPTPANYDDPKTWASGVLNTGQSRVEPTGASPQAETSEQDVPVLRIVVTRDVATEYYAAEFRSADDKVGGMGDYSATPVGALANLCATLIQIDEDNSVERRKSAPVSPVEPEPPTLEPCAHELDYHNCAECVGPKVEPEPCVWRGLPYVKTTCGQSRWVPVDLQPLVSSFNKCPYCGAPLKVEREP